MEDEFFDLSYQLFQITSEVLLKFIHVHTYFSHLLPFHLHELHSQLHQIAQDSVQGMWSR